MYIVFILQCQKIQNKYQIVSKEQTSVILIIYNGVLCNVPHLCYYRFILPFLQMNQVPEKLYQSWSLTVYIRKLSSQDNLTAQIEPMQDKTSYLTNYRYKSTLLVDEIDYTNQYRGYYWSYYNPSDKYTEIQHLC